MEERELPEADRLKERIKFNLEILRLAVIITLSIGGSVISQLLAGPESVSAWIVIAFGGFMAFIAFRIALRTYLKLKTKLDKL